MEDRMLSDEILLGIINSKSGGGGGIGDYNKLKNQPQIGGVTLTGNKTASELDLATETALANKADKSAIKNEFIGTLDEWNALTTEQKKAYDTYQIKGDYTGGRYIYLPTIYSEEERQVGVWTDGKPIYQKSFIIENPITLVANEWTDTGIQKPNNIELVVSAEIYRQDNLGPIFASASAKNTRYIQLQCPLAYSLNAGSIITIQYTKTTDTAGFGIWTPSGEIAHHYSTDEQIVGTWIDGSTVYERTIDFGSDITIDNNWQTTSEPNTNMDKCISAILMSSSGNVRTNPSVQLDYGSYIRICYNNWTDTGRYLTIQYTKTE